MKKQIQFFRGLQLNKGKRPLNTHTKKSSYVQFCERNTFQRLTRKGYGKISES